MLGLFNYLPDIRFLVPGVDVPRDTRGDNDEPCCYDHTGFLGTQNLLQRTLLQHTSTTSSTTTSHRTTNLCADDLLHDYISKPVQVWVWRGLRLWGRQQMRVLWVMWVQMLSTTATPAKAYATSTSPDDGPTNASVLYALPDAHGKSRISQYYGNEFMTLMIIMISYFKIKL